VFKVKLLGGNVSEIRAVGNTRFNDCKGLFVQLVADGKLLK